MKLSIFTAIKDGLGCARIGLSAGVVAATLVAPVVTAQPFSTLQSRQWLLVGMGPVNETNGRPGVGNAIDINDFEIGANKAPVPSTSGFLNGGSSGGPGLLGNVPNIPLNARPVFSGICGDGNIAVTHPGGRYNLQNIGLYADIGVQTAGPLPLADDNTSNSFFNDPNQFPNTFTPTGFTNPGVNNNTGGFGNFVGPGDAVQSTRMDGPNYAGITPNTNHTPLTAELAAARLSINGLPQTGSLNVSGSSGVINTSTTITLAPGLNIIDIVTGGSDFSLQNANLVIDGPAGSGAIFRVPDHANFLVSQANILIGNGGIDLGSVLFYTDREDNGTHFSFNNTVLNGVAFWSLGEEGGGINVNNAQGCTQLIADRISSINDVRFCRCGFEPVQIPGPGTSGLAVMCALWAGRRRAR